MENIKEFEKTVKVLIEIMTKRSLAQLVAAFLMLEEEREDLDNIDNIREEINAKKQA